MFVRLFEVLRRCAGLALLACLLSGCAASYHAEVSGAVEASLSRGSISYEYAGDMETPCGTIPEGRTLTIESISTLGILRIAILYLPPSPQPGTYTVIDPPRLHHLPGCPKVEPDDYSAAFFDFSSTGPYEYSVQLDGTITIEETGDIISGSFTFTAAPFVLGRIPSEPVTVIGWFRNVPYQGRP